MRIINSYTLDELCNEHKCISIETQDGVCLSISVEHGVTLVLFPFGNNTERPENFGHLSNGVAVKPIEKPLTEQGR